jgi:serine/threonine protein kinase
MQLVEALDFVHSMKFVHRDIKPSNILVRQKGNEFVLKIGDFGSGIIQSNLCLISDLLAKSLTTQSYRAKTGMVGSVSYKYASFLSLLNSD